jgi:hypothetical protein
VTPLGRRNLIGAGVGVVVSRPCAFLARATSPTDEVRGTLRLGDDEGSRVGRRTLFLSTGVVLAAGSLSWTSPARAQTEDISSRIPASEVLRVLGEGVVGDPQSAQPLGDPATVARWEPGEWKYRITAGARRGETEREILAPIDATTRGETWERTIGQEYTLYLRRTAEGSLILPTEIAHAHKALVHFEPPLSYLTAGLGPGERSVFQGKMDVYSSSDPATKWYSGRIQATTVYAGVYRVTTPAGAFNAALIRTDYRIDILAVVSVRDTLYTFYADGVGKVAEAEHRRISAIGLLNTDTKIGKVLVSFPPAASPPTRIEAP